MKKKEVWIVTELTEAGKFISFFDTKQAAENYVDTYGVGKVDNLADYDVMAQKAILDGGSVYDYRIST